MPSAFIPSHPVLSLEAAGILESALFGGDERKEWAAMLQAGRAVAAALVRDCQEMGGLPADARILVLAGKGNNAGDALIAARTILELCPGSSCDVLFAFGSRKLKPLAAKAWRDLSESAENRVNSLRLQGLAPSYHLCIDGIFGYQYRPPLPAEAVATIAAADRCALRFRASVDLPTGLSEAGAFRADFTYATGSVKDPVIDCGNAGRPRYLDLGFFSDENAAGHRGVGNRIILPSVLSPLAGLRPPGADKRSQGHLAIVGGSAGFPGAVLMNTLAALQSGVGLVTTFVPERLAAVYAARAPEAMWVGLPETADGALALRGLDLFLKGSQRATALSIGSGMGRNPKTQALALAIVGKSKIPVVIDADALQPDIVRAGSSHRILTPHAGEFARIAEGSNLKKLSAALSAAIIEKGPVTKVCSGGPVYHSFFGGPVLSRGGSGDLLAGLTGGLLAQTPGEPMLAACRSAVLHGMTADALARSRGQTAVRILEWLDFLSPVLRESDLWPENLQKSRR